MDAGTVTPAELADLEGRERIAACARAELFAVDEQLEPAERWLANAVQAIAVQAHATVLVAQRHRIARVTARVEQGIKKELEAMRATIHDDGDIGQIVADLERRTGRSLPLPSITWPAWKLTTPSITTETP